MARHPHGTAPHPRKPPSLRRTNTSTHTPFPPFPPFPIPPQVTYPLHIILRYELERGLMDGSVQVDDIPRLWNEKMQVGGMAWVGGGVGGKGGWLGERGRKAYGGRAAAHAFSMPSPCRTCRRRPLLMPPRPLPARLSPRPPLSPPTSPQPLILPTSTPPTSPTHLPTTPILNN